MGRTSETKRAEPRNAMRSISVGRNLPPVEASEAAAIASSSRPQTSHAAPKGTTFRGKTRHKYLGRRRRRYAPRANLLRPSSARYFAMCRRMVWRCARRRIQNLNDPLSVLEGAILSAADGAFANVLVPQAGNRPPGGGPLGGSYGPNHGRSVRRLRRLRHWRLDKRWPTIGDTRSHNGVHEISGVATLAKLAMDGRTP